MGKKLNKIKNKIKSSITDKPTRLKAVLCGLALGSTFGLGAAFVAKKR